ncbi:hypothetical protein J7E70_13085 [Variovorax paradoxus]|nr:hypothetical protein [Variovorax paradoxus]MBT2301395.1 hypothetical protein [Variovorax paradoxus]
MPDSVDGYGAAGIDGLVAKPMIVEQWQRVLASVAAGQYAPLQRMRRDIGERRFQEILVHSRKSFAAMSAQVALWERSARIPTASLSRMLHRLMPAARMLVFGDRADEADSRQLLVERDDAGTARVGTQRIQGLLDAAVCKLEMAASRLGDAQEGCLAST